MGWLQVQIYFNTILGTRTCWVLAADDSSSIAFARISTFQRSSNNLTNGKGCKYSNGPYHLNTACYWIYCITENHTASSKKISSSSVSFVGGKITESLD